MSKRKPKKTTPKLLDSGWTPPYPLDNVQKKAFKKNGFFSQPMSAFSNHPPPPPLGH